MSVSIMELFKVTTMRLDSEAIAEVIREEIPRFILDYDVDSSR